MATTLQFRRGTTSELAAITGAEAELFVDTDKGTVVVMDGVTAGGIPLAKESTLSNYATQSYVTTAISNVIDAAPAALDTLNELAAALGDDANYASTVTNALAAKADTSSLATVATSGSYNDLTNKPTIPSLTGYATESYVTTAVSTKQDTLVSGTSIKTVNSQSLLGSGNILIAGGSGLFNSSINNAVGYALTTTMANAVSFASDAIVHSIFLCNTGAAAITANANFTPTGGSAIGIFRAVPLPVGSSVEVLKKPMVVKSGDVLQLQASANSSSFATIVFETTTNTDFKRAIALAQASAASTLYTSTSVPSVIESIKVANVDTTVANHAITVYWTNSADVIKSYFCFNLIVPSGATIELSENPRYMAAGDKIMIQAVIPDDISVFLSAKSIT